MQILESGEDYLETILMLDKRQASVHSIHVAEELGLSRPSVSVAMKKLEQGGYITVNGAHEITLTASGREIAEMIYERHVLFTAVLQKLGIEPETARRDACRMEHAISAGSFEVLKRYFIQTGLCADVEENMNG